MRIEKKEKIKHRKHPIYSNDIFGSIFGGFGGVGAISGR
jgi:hypothetical protein